MVKVTVEFDVDTSKVGRGWFERRLEMDFNVNDGHGCKQIKVTKVSGPEQWK